MAGQYTGLTLASAQGLLLNQGLSINGNLIATFGLYNSYTSTGLFKNIVASANVLLDSVTYQTLLQVGASSIPAITNSIPQPQTSTLGAYYTNGLLQYVYDRANLYIGGGINNKDLSKFAQIFFSAQSYAQQSTSFVAASYNGGQNNPTVTYPGSNSLITGGISDLSFELANFGRDFENAGLAINLRNIYQSGSPVTIMQNLALGGSIPNSVIAVLLDQGISADVIGQMPEIGYPIAGIDNKNAYIAFQKITQNNLRDCLTVLRCKTTGLNNLADLLNPVKLFPNSYLSMTVRVGSNLLRIYAGRNTINPALPNLGSRLQALLPPDQAQAWYALERGLTSIKGSENLETTAMGQLMQNLFITNDLPNVASLNQYVPPATQLYFADSFSNGTGPGNTITIFDTMGTVAGWPAAGEIVNSISNLNSFNQSQLISDTGVFIVMQNTLAGDYGPISGPITIPPGLPGAGTYTDADLAFQSGLIPAARSILTQIAATNAQANLNCFNAWSNIGNQLIRENQFINSTGVTFNNLESNSTTSIMSFATNLHDYGTDKTTQGYFNFISALADYSNTGQYIVGALREGYNMSQLEALGISLDNSLNTNL